MHKGCTDVITATTLLVSHKSCRTAHRWSHHLAQTGRRRQCSYSKGKATHTAVSSFTAWWKSPRRLTWETAQMHCHCEGGLGKDGFWWVHIKFCGRAEDSCASPAPNLALMLNKQEEVGEITRKLSQVFQHSEGGSGWTSVSSRPAKVTYRDCLKKKQVQKKKKSNNKKGKKDKELSAWRKVHDCNPSTWKSESEFKASLGYVVKACLRGGSGVLMTNAR